MTLANLGFLFLGAVLVACGVLVASLADRVRGLRIERRSPIAPRPQARTRQPLADAPRAPDPVEPDPIADARVAADVIAALVAAGYDKRAAKTAVSACGAADRGSIADWTRAALRRTREEVVS